MNGNMSEYEKKIEELKKRLKTIEKTSSSKIDDITSISNEIEALESQVYTDGSSFDISKRLSQLEKKIAANIRAFREKNDQLSVIFNEIQSIQSIDIFDGPEVLSSEEINKRREEQAKKLSEVFEEYNKVLHEIDARKKALISLRNELGRNVELASSLHIEGIDFASFEDMITSILGKNPNLVEITKKPLEEQTDDEKKALKAAQEEVKERIFGEVSSGKTIAESIEILYGLDIKMTEEKKAAAIKVAQDRVKRLNLNAYSKPFRFVGGNQPGVKEPLKAPDDMFFSRENASIEKVRDIVGKYFEYVYTSKNNSDDNDKKLEEVIAEVEKILPGVNKDELIEKVNSYVEKFSNFYDVTNNLDGKYSADDLTRANSDATVALHEITSFVSDYYHPERVASDKIVSVLTKYAFNAYSLKMGFAGSISKEDNIVELLANAREILPEMDENIIKKLAEDFADAYYNSFEVSDDFDRDHTPDEVKAAEDRVYEVQDAAKDYVNSYFHIKDDDQYNVDFSGMTVEELQRVKEHIKEQVKNHLLEKKEAKKRLDAIEKEMKKRGVETKPPISKENDSKKSDEKPVVYSVQNILANLTKGLSVGKKDVKRFTASNIRVRNTFKEELHSGNVLYNVVHVVPTVFKATVSFFRKLGAKLMLTKTAKKNVETLKSRINGLSEGELQYLFDNYRGNAIVADMNLQINDLLQAKLKEFGLSKVQKLNERIKENYSKLFILVGQINALDKKTDKASIKRKKELYDKASIYVKNILSFRKEANNLLSGGVHGQEEDFKAAATKMNYVGLRFSKIDDFDTELQQRLGETELRMNQAIASDESKATVDKFLELEALYCKNTEVKKSIVGRRSVGAKCYSPLAEELNYKDDPFIRDLFTSIAVTSATVSAFKAIGAQRVISEHNQQIAQANSNNQATIDYVHQTGNDIASRREAFAEGMKAQGHSDALGTAGVGERYALDGSNWHISSDTYRNLDSQFHAYSSENYANISSQINDVASRYGQGTITNAQALQELSTISTTANNSLVQLATQYKDILANYASSHPEFDLSAFQGSIDYLVSHSDAIANMNQSMVDVTNLGGGLADVTLQQIEPLTVMPGLYSSLIAAASSAALASGVSKGMKAKERERDISELSQMLMEGYGEDKLKENERGHYI